MSKREEPKTPTEKIEDYWATLNEYREKLSTQQIDFLDTRIATTTDVEAAETVGMPNSSVSRWKRTDENFHGAYNLVVEKLSYGNILHTGARKDLIRAQLETITKILPVLVQEQIQIALHGEKPADRLRAITDLYERVGFTAERNMPVGAHNQVFLQILNMIAPQVRNEAGRRGLPTRLPIETVIDAVVRETTEEEV